MFKYGTEEVGVYGTITLMDCCEPKIKDSAITINAIIGEVIQELEVPDFITIESNLLQNNEDHNCRDCDDNQPNITFIYKNTGSLKHESLPIDIIRTDKFTDISSSIIERTIFITKYGWRSPDTLVEIEAERCRLNYGPSTSSSYEDRDNYSSENK